MNMWTQVKTKLMLDVPFFASLLLDLCTVKFDKSVPTLGTDGKTIWINEDFFNALSLREAVFAVCHEVGHVMFIHMARAREYEQTGLGGMPFSYPLWNVAGDYVINAMLVEARIGSINPNWLLKPEYSGKMRVEEVYLDLLKKHQDGQKKGKQQQAGGGSGSSGQAQDGIGEPDTGKQKRFDEHRKHEGTAMTSHEKKRVEQSIAAAASTAKAMGNLPGSIERLVTEVLDAKVSWAEMLRHYVTTEATRDTTTWSRPHRRRLVSQKIYMPAATGFGAGHVVYAIDTSGSMDQKSFNAANAELDEILRTCAPSRVTLLGCDTEVEEPVELEPGESIADNPPKLKGGGGTSFVPVFDWIKENCDENPAVLIYFTDMYGRFPDECPPYPVIWVTTSSITHKWGHHVHVQL